MKVYPAGIQHFINVNFGGPRIADMVPLYYTLRGIRRVQGPSFTRISRAPITISMLSSFHQAVPSFTPVRSDQLMWRAASSIAFFGLLRSSEYTAPSTRQFDPLVHLLRQNISFNSDFSVVLILIKSSKTDPFRRGTTVRIGSSGHHVCAVSAILAYLRVRVSSEGPLFVFHAGAFLTRAHVSAALQRVFPQRVDLNTHSFRIGGASAAAAAGCSDAQIRALGRWRSDVFVSYLRLPDGAFSALADRMVDSSHTIRVWDGHSLTSRPGFG